MRSLITQQYKPVLYNLHLHLILFPMFDRKVKIISLKSLKPALLKSSCNGVSQSNRASSVNMNSWFQMARAGESVPHCSDGTEHSFVSHVRDGCSGFLLYIKHDSLTCSSSSLEILSSLSRSYNRKATAKK